MLLKSCNAFLWIWASTGKNPVSRYIALSGAFCGKDNNSIINCFSNFFCSVV
jgi:hypothetical protein